MGLLNPGGPIAQFKRNRCSISPVELILQSGVRTSGVDVKTLSSMLGHYSAGFTLDTYTHITNDMQRGAAEKIGGFMESVTAANTPEPPDPPEENRCRVIPFEKVG